MRQSQEVPDGMVGEACPMPTPKSNDERSAVEAMLGMKRIAVVGISNDPFRPSRYVSEYLAERGCSCEDPAQGAGDGHASQSG